MSYIVCGWYTPDYKPYWDKLRPTLEAVGAKHDFVEAATRTGSWETTTLRKASEVAFAMKRNPNKTIIFLDVDCVVHEPLDDLAALKGDVGLCINGSANRKGRQKIRLRTGTMVFHPTAEAQLFVWRWDAANKVALPRATDQTTIGMVLHQPGLTISIVGREWCAIGMDGIANPKIEHTSASAALGLHGWRNWFKGAA